MIVLSHRGYWRTPTEKNTPTAFARSFQLGYGTETDLRDLCGKLVVSHDPPSSAVCTAESLFGIHREIDGDLPLAINVKADGLQKLLAPIIEQYSVNNWFVFDMSVPDALGWLRIGCPTFTRHSDEEPNPAYYDRAAGVWLDSFRRDWWDASVVARHLHAGKRVCVVSPELQGRDPRYVWDLLASVDFRSDPRLMLCTDRPVEATAACG